MERLSPQLRRPVEAARVARLATVRPDATPHVVPVTFVLDGDLLVTAVDAKPKTTTSLQRLRNIRANPAVSVLVDHYHDDWVQLWWARADGSARVEDPEAIPDAIDRLAAKYPQYRQRRPLGPVIVVTIQRWSAWSATGSGEPDAASGGTGR